MRNVGNVQQMKRITGTPIAIIFKVFSITRTAHATIVSSAIFFFSFAALVKLNLNIRYAHLEHSVLDIFTITSIAKQNEKHSFLSLLTENLIE